MTGSAPSHAIHVSKPAKIDELIQRIPAPRRDNSNSLTEQNYTKEKGHEMKPATRSLNLPKPIAAYFAADKSDGEAVSQCFTENAVVKDEGHTHKGRAAI